MLRRIVSVNILVVMLLQIVMVSAWSVESKSTKKAPFNFSEKQKKHRFFQYFKNFDLEDQQSFPGKNSVLCIGSSSMLKWKKTIHEDLAPLKVTHRGFGGSTMNDVLIFKDFFQRYKAKRIVIYEGDNDLWGGTTPEKFLSNCKEFVDYIHKKKPKTKFYFLAVKPSIRRQSKWDKFQQANKLLKAYSKTSKKLFYIDIATPMLKKDGSIRDDIFGKDNLHMNAKGYMIWTKVVRAVFGLKKK